MGYWFWLNKKGECLITISTHNGTAAHRAHNIRAEKVVDKQLHIDKEGHFEIWRDEDPRLAYDRLFGEAVKEYNEKQTRDDRKIDDYFNKIKDSKQQNPVYEIIIQIGNKENHLSQEESREILKEYFKSWEERNPNLEMIGAYYHNDERGAPHLHIDYIPVAQYERGLSVRTGLNKALEQQDHLVKRGKDTPQIQWERKENQALERLVRDRGHKVEHPQKESKEKAHHRSVREYKAFKEEERIDRLEQKQKERAVNLEAKEKDIERKENQYQEYNKAVDRYLERYGLTEAQYQRELYLSSKNNFYPPEPEKLNPERSKEEREEIERVYNEHERQEQERTR